MWKWVKSEIKVQGLLPTSAADPNFNTNPVLVLLTVTPILLTLLTHLSALIVLIYPSHTSIPASYSSHIQILPLLTIL